VIDKCLERVTTYAPAYEALVVPETFYFWFYSELSIFFRQLNALIKFVAQGTNSSSILLNSDDVDQLRSDFSRILHNNFGPQTGGPDNNV
jgi:hypothetical protein